jgi:hypothetical protein
MILNDKCLLVVKPAEGFQQWLESVLALANPTKERPKLSLNTLQSDSNCYIIPSLSPDHAAHFVKDHAEPILRRELSAWCRIPEVWPTLDFLNLVSSFQFDFYYDWLDFKSESIHEKQESLNTIVLLIKPKEKLTEYLHTLLVQQFQLSPAEADKKLNLDLIRNGSTAVISNVQSLDDVDSFLEQHAEEVFTHQLILWGGEDSRSLWPRDTDFRAFKESFEIEIHQHTFLMLH